MHLGIFTDSLSFLSTDELLEVCRRLGFTGIELGVGGWSSAAHIDVAALLKNKEHCTEYLRKLDDSGVKIDALNISGNPLDPAPRGKKHAADVFTGFELAEQLGVKKIVMMSGLPAGCSEDKTPTWILTSWPPETADILKYQWETATLFWEKVVQSAHDHGIEKIALEPHGWHLVYNVESLLHLRKNLGKAGDIVGMNMDPSHPFWMGADPVEMVRVLGRLVYHCHVKDILVRPSRAAVNTMLDPKDVHRIQERSWNFAVPGAGHDEHWWNGFVRELRLAGYDDTLSFEMEDYIGEPLDQLAYGVRVLSHILQKY
jgi:sugar phosphate isomerase/epimerase